MRRTAVITGLGAAVPPRVVTNQMLTERLDTSDEWIFTRTGIRQRRVVGPGMATSDLAVAAGRQALQVAGGGSADMVVVATTTPDQPCPATAPQVASRLGMLDAAAFDVAAVCSGFVYALAAGAGAISAGIARRVLVIGAEAFTSIIDPQDRSTAAIFGDGAGAVVLEAGRPGQPGELLGFDLGSDGDLAELIMVRAGGSRQRAAGERADGYFAMQGAAVFKHAVLRMAESTTALLSRVGWAVDDVDWLVPHQANVRIVHAVADQLALPRQRAVTNIEEYGNTSAASIPLALTDGGAAGVFTAGDRVVLSAFGGGVTWGSVALTWPRLRPSRPVVAPVASPST
jgi:3-oxoacyl-[acyl-carrier-protein] synthase-3